MPIPPTDINLLNQEQSIHYFFTKMDIEMIDALLDNDKTYAHFNKTTFISKLKIVFEEFATNGDKNLISIDGKCNSCYKGKKGYTFVGNKSNNYLSLIFETENNKIKDISDCANFKTKKNNFKLNERLFIDNELSIPF